LTFAPRRTVAASPMAGAALGLMVAASAAGRSLAAIRSYWLNKAPSQSCTPPRHDVQTKLVFADSFIEGNARLVFGLQLGQPQFHKLGHHWHREAGRDFVIP
jgi:hypothetical protein